MEVTLIQCTNSKRDEPAKAKDLYDTSQYYLRMREWAEARGHDWLILSAKHGLLHPQDRIEPYDERGLSDEQASHIASVLADQYDTIHITAGMDYTDPLVPELERRGIDVINHFAGCKIGERRQKLKYATERLKSETL